MNYDLTPYIADPTERWLRTRVTWTPREGDTTSAIGDYVDGMGGTASLGCGIEEAADAIGLLAELEDTEKYLVVCDLINRQLAQRPWAVLVCPEGTARLELVELR
ncbi:hypothetical protein [Mycobacteroides abscessus]|uniref:hypothetical protein n=1 Tax=Mycobacteroides abscessus TaxID=36809 RepID=UPI00092835C7|nr:hypothetical protein [Mycobacteroides abscessus]SIF35974.1 Uncharacterised protein [Mycobacteroides abscessus subsp. abscessus]